MKRRLTQACFVSSDGTLGGGTIGSRTPGIYLFGAYFSNSGWTMDSTFDISYYEITTSGDRIPVTGYDVQPEILSLGENIIPISGTDFVTSATMYLADTFNVTSTSGVSFVSNPSVSALLSGGAESETLPSAVVRSNYILVNLEGDSENQGDNDLFYKFLDPNSQEFSASNEIVVRYAPDVYVTEVDGDCNVENAITDEYAVDLTYIIGGVFGYDEDNQIAYDVSGCLGYTGGTSAIEPSVQLNPAENTITLGSYADDFGNSTFAKPIEITKIPKVEYVGLTSIDEETYGTSYTATSGLKVDVGAPYETAVDVTFTFVSSAYGNYNFNPSYTYPNTDLSASTPVTIDYQADAGYESDAVQSWVFGTPSVGNSGTFVVTSGAYESVTDIIADDGDFTTGVVAERMPQEMSSLYNKAGATFDITGTQQSRLLKPYTGNEGWFLAEHSFVMNVIGPTLYSADFEYTLMMNDFNTRVAMIRNEANEFYSITDKAGAVKTSPHSTEGLPQTIIVGINSSNEYRIETSEGGTLTIGSFGGYPTSEMAIGYKFGTTTKVCNVLIHEITILPYFPDAGQRTAIYSRAVDKWFTEEPVQGNTITQDGYSSVTQDGYSNYTIL
jgi:hypothetical protein